MIAALAILGRTNAPIYLKVVSQNDDPLKFHFIVHSALDIIEERMKRKGKLERLDKYLGLLCPVEEFKVYGFITNTDVKLLLIVQEEYTLKDQELRQFFNKFQDLYIAAACNPFYETNTEIKSPKFEQGVVALVVKGLAAS